MKYHTLEIPTLDATMRVSGTSVLPSNWKKFIYPRTEPPEGPSTSSDPSHNPQVIKNKYMSQRIKLNYVVHNLNLSKQKARSRLLQ